MQSNLCIYVYLYMHTITITLPKLCDTRDDLVDIIMTLYCLQYFRCLDCNINI